MLYSLHMLRDYVVRLKNFYKTIKEGYDIENNRSKFNTLFYDMLFAAEEIRFTMNRHEELKEIILNSMQALKTCETAEGLKSLIANITDQFTEEYNWSYPTTYDFVASRRAHLMDHKVLLKTNMTSIVDHIIPVNRNVNIIDVCCGEGNNIQHFRPVPNSVLYGIEESESRAKIARPYVDRLAMGNLSGSRISNDAFDVLLMNTNPTWEIPNGTEHMRFLKSEKNLFQSTIKYVRPGGLVVYILPYYRLYRDVCIMLSKALKDVQVRRLIDYDFDRSGLICIIGYRDIKKEADETVYNTLRKFHDPSRIPDFINEPLKDLILPQGLINIDLFRGSVLDMDEMKSIMDASGCYNTFWQNQDVEKINENVKQPLLPFNLGQIGLVLTSGVLDGIVDEDEEHAHIIKGRVSKKTDTERTLDENNTINVNETISNRVEINTFLPNGEYRILA